MKRFILPNLWTLPLLCIFWNWNGPVCQGFASSRISQERYSPLSSSLSDDDDFALVGLNAETPPESLTVASDDQSLFSVLSQATTASEDASPPRRYDRHIQQSTATPAEEAWMGLTEEGDFVLEGVNAHDPDANKAKEKYGTPLVDPNKEGLLEGGLLSQLSSKPAAATLLTPSNQDILGLQDDGDLANPGFNIASQPAEQDRSNMAMIDRQKQQPALSIPDTRTMTSLSRTRDKSLEQVEDMTFWLQEIIPTLRDDDCIHYAEGLVSLGFDPNCVTASELQRKDLEPFMKPLHMRYLLRALGRN